MVDNGLVHIIDDDGAVRDSLVFLLRTARYEVRSYDSAVTFLADFKADGPGCIITDVRMPEVSGIELLHRLKERGIDLPVIVITGHGDIALAVEAMKAGAVDFLEKPFDDERVVAAIASALDRSRMQAGRSAGRAQIAARLATLSQRERQVLDALVAGAPNKSIAHDLGISPRTVEVYRANVMTKMEAGSLPELVRMVLAVSSD
jgi:two-component system response regulator FixJ